MSTKHLGPGSKDIPIEDKKLRLYSMRFCPYAHRVHLVLYAKNISHDTVYINLKTKPEWFLEKFPLAKVPALVSEGSDLYESLIVSEYIDDKYQQNKLFPTNPLQKARDKIIIELFNKVITAFYKCQLSPTLEISMLTPIFDELDYFEKELKTRGTPFFCGEKPGMVDYMIWPWCERLEIIKALGGSQFKVPKERFPHLLHWCTAMLEDEAVKKHYLTPEQHTKYIQSYKAGTPDYDNIV